MKKYIYKIGDTFGRLTLLEEIPKRKFIAKCICNNIKKYDKYSILSGHTKSCGCIRIENTSKLKYKHGLRYTRLNSIWKNMRKRCFGKNEPNYKNYGARGITICNEWSEFINFYNWAINNGYQEHLTIERKNVNGNYSPENCCWILRSEQNKNTRCCVKITAFGETKNLADWAKDSRCKVSSRCIINRIKRGINPEIAITTEGYL